MQGREHNMLPLSLEEPTTTTLMPPTSPCPCTHTCPLHRRASCAGLPPACMFSFFFFLLTSSFVVQSLRSHHLPCRQTCGCPLLPGPATTTVTAQASGRTAPVVHAVVSRPGRQDALQAPCSRQGMLYQSFPLFFS